MGMRLAGWLACWNTMIPLYSSLPPSFPYFQAGGSPLELVSVGSMKIPRWRVSFWLGGWLADWLAGSLG